MQHYVPSKVKFKYKHVFLFAVLGSPQLHHLTFTNKCILITWNINNLNKIKN